MIYPDKNEIASLEYYQKNLFVGNCNVQIRNLFIRMVSMEVKTGIRIAVVYGGYEDGGSGKGRGMWRTFDYTN